MPTVQVAALPSSALLAAYVGTGAYTDCYSVKLPRPASLAEFMAAFSTPHRCSIWSGGFSLEYYASRPPTKTLTHWRTAN